MPPLTPIAQALLLINVVVFCLQYFLGFWLDQVFALWPIGAGFLPWQIVTYAFLHGSFRLGGLLFLGFLLFGLLFFRLLVLVLSHWFGVEELLAGLQFRRRWQSSK